MGDSKGRLYSSSSTVNGIDFSVNPANYKNRIAEYTLRKIYIIQLMQPTSVRGDEDMDSFPHWCPLA